MHQHKKLTLVAMIFAVSMTFIDQTIVSISIPSIQEDVDLSATGAQWIVNGYLLSLAAMFAFGGKIADIAGHRRMVLIGITIFATSSALCGAAPTGSAGEAWLILFRVIQGAGAAIMFPAALAIVVAAFPQAERGRALAIFFGVAGGMTALGPILGGYLIEVTWRAIFWINVPIAIAAVLLTLKAKPDDTRRPAPIDYRGFILFALGMGLVVLGLQQSSTWGWGDPLTIGSIVSGAILMAAFVRAELAAEHPLMQMRFFSNRAFAVDNVILLLISIAFVPMFLFASLYSQISLGDSATGAGLYIGTFFLGFVVSAQRGGAVLDKKGAKAAVLPGCIIAAIGFYLWANTMPDTVYSEGGGWWRVVLAGVGTGMVLGPVSTDALNRVPGTSYGEATGITQTARNLGASLGLAVLGTILISQNRTNVDDKLTALGCPTDVARGVADGINGATSGSGGGSGALEGLAKVCGSTAADLGTAISDAFALSSQVLFFIMAGAMALAAVVAKFGMPGGKAPELGLPQDATEPQPEAAPPAGA